MVSLSVSEKTPTYSPATSYHLAAPLAAIHVARVQKFQRLQHNFKQSKSFHTHSVKHVPRTLEKLQSNLAT
jgi:hypothetical protein